MRLAQGPKEEVDRDRSAAVPVRGAQAQMPVVHGQVVRWWNHVDVIALDRSRIGCEKHRHRRRAAEDLRQFADVAYVGMLQIDDGQTGIRWDVPQNVEERLEPAGRGADADDREMRIFRRRGTLARLPFQFGWDCS